MDGPIQPRPADPLGEALHLLRMDGAFYCRSELHAPWGHTLPPLPGYLWFHVVTSGAVELLAGDEILAPGVPKAAVDHFGGEGRKSRRRWGPHVLASGDLALVPHGTGHVLRSGPGVPVPDIRDLDSVRVSDRYETRRQGEDGPRTTLLCGAVRFGHPAAATLVAVLPEIVHLGGGTERMQGTLALLAAEAREPRLGGEAVITRLADILVIQAIRSWLEREPDERPGWLGALHDPHIGRAISLIHADPARDWTVESLARELAMSRSSFAARFTQLVGEPAMAYVTRWRMQVATAALREERTTIAELASRLGYRSEAAFARAFKRETGMPPGAVRRLPDSIEAFA